MSGKTNTVEMKVVTSGNNKTVEGTFAFARFGASFFTFPTLTKDGEGVDIAEFSTGITLDNTCMNLPKPSVAVRAAKAVIRGKKDEFITKITEAKAINSNEEFDFKAPSEKKAKKEKAPKKEKVAKKTVEKAPVEKAPVAKKKAVAKKAPAKKKAVKKLTKA